MSNHLIENLSVGHTLPNGWTVMAYAVSDRHAVLLCSMTRTATDIRFATWTVSNDDLRSTAGGNYFGGHLVNRMELAWADWKSRVAAMYQLS